MTENTGLRIVVQGGGSSVGVKAAGQATSDIGMASREIKESDLAEFSNLKIFVIARDGIAIVAHPDVPVSDLTVEQVRDIFSGKITNWKDLGGDDQNIIVVSREEGSGTRAAFERNGYGRRCLDRSKRHFAGFQRCNPHHCFHPHLTPLLICLLGYLDDTVKSISIDGVAPTEPNARDGSYPIVRPLNMLTNGEPAAWSRRSWIYPE